jgi:LmbE family N-acetylglucosaminyl deacetylase
MTQALAFMLAALLTALAALHLYWASGGRRGLDAVLPERPGGERLFSPRRAETAAVAVLLLVAALVVLGTSGLLALPVPDGWLRAGTWTLAVALLLRAVGEFRYVGFFKRVRGTRFARWDSRLHSPLCLAMAALAFGVGAGAA